MKFKATIRYWRPEREGGLAVADIPSEHIAALGGLKQARVRGTINGGEYVSNVMPAGSGRLALSVSQKMMKAAGRRVGDEPSSRSSAPRLQMLDRRWASRGLRVGRDAPGS